MKGFVNTAVVPETNEAGGDLVYAANKTGATLTAGQKVLLNFGYRIETIKVVENFLSSALKSWCLADTHGNIYNSGGYAGNGYHKFVWNGTDNYENVYIASNIEQAYGNISMVDGFWRFSTSSTSGRMNIGSFGILTDSGYVCPENYIYLGHNLGYSNGGIKSRVYLYKTNFVNGIIGESIATLFVGTSSSQNLADVTDVISDGKKLLAVCTKTSYGGGFKVFDVQDTSNVQLLYSTTSLPVKYFIGMCGSDTDDIVLGLPLADNSITPSSLDVYRFNEDSSLRKCVGDEIPEDLRDIGTGTFLYNSETGILTQGCYNSFKVFQYDSVNKTFYRINLGVEETFTPPVVSYWRSTFVTYAPQTNDLVLSFKEYSGGTSRNRAMIWIYKLGHNDSGMILNENKMALYSPSQSLTAMATGNVNENGLAEVKTVLPDIVTLKLVINPAPETYEFIGGLNDN